MGVAVDTSNTHGGVMGQIRGPAGAATMAGTLEIAFFHPFDTVAKRLMSNKSNLSSMSAVNETVFKQHAQASFGNKVAYLYPGSTYAVLYKVLQRVYKFAGQPIVRDALTKSGMTDSMKPVLGNKSKMMTESVAGCMIGIGEIVLLPLDRMKVMSQTNEGAMKGQGVIKLIKSEGMGLYAGAGVTAMRNAPGSFCLFGGTAFAKDIIFGLNDYRDATVVQNMVASGFGSVLSITITNPMDVIKTRIQNKNFGEKHSGLTIMRDLVKEEGASAFFKGVTPKVFASAPKLIFAYTMTEFFIGVLRGTKKN
jgi:hypothetical protein